MSDATVDAPPMPMVGAADAPARGTALKIVATVLVVVSAVGALIYFSMDASAAYYMHVDEALVRKADLKGKRIQVHGFVVKDSIEQKNGTLQYRFRMHTKPPRDEREIVAYYTGIVPDTFKSESEVVATGHLDENNQLSVEAGGVMAKCPSKYQEGVKTDLLDQETRTGSSKAAGY